MATMSLPASHRGQGAQTGSWRILRRLVFRFSCPNRLTRLWPDLFTFY